jgi:anaerobic selenocysteine-containing dehydrogenase
MKAVIEADDVALADDAPRTVDIDFINGHTLGFEDLAADVRAASWESIERQSGLSRGDLRAAANIILGLSGRKSACCWHLCIIRRRNSSRVPRHSRHVDVRQD